MRIFGKISNSIVTLLLGFFVVISSQLAPDHAFAQTPNLDELFSELQSPDLEDWKPVEEKIWRIWKKSGSAAMDLLLQRGQKALKEGRINDAIGHFSALIDHAPNFAEGWNARATAFFVADRYGLSIADIQQTLALNPRHFGAIAGLGNILERMEQPRRALKAYKLAQKIHPHRPDVRKAVERLTKEVEGTSL